MKRNLLFICLLTIFTNVVINAQNIGIGTNTPNPSALLDINSTTKGLLIPRLSTAQRTAITTPAKGLMVYDTNLKGIWFFDSTWSAVGSNNANYWNLIGSNIASNNAGNVGIGISNPAYKLDITGSLHTSSDAYFGGYVGIGTTSPFYKLQVNDGSVAIYNTTDAKTWYFNYSSSSNYFQLSESGTPRIVVSNGGNVGIGTTTPAYKLDVAGALRTSGNIEGNGSLSIEGAATVNNGKGVAYNLGSGTNLKIAPFTTATFYAVLGGHQLSAEGSFALPSGFTSAPRVYIGDIDVTGGTAGELYRVQLMVYGCTTTSCKARLLNTSPNAVNYTITWNMLAIGY